MPIRDRYDSAEKEHFHFVNLNPAGRHTADCVIRAMASFFGWSWEEVMKDLCAFCIENGYVPNYKSGFGAYLICQGCKPEKTERKCSVKEFLENYAKPGYAYLVTASNHMTCIRDGKIIDTWDCSGRQVKLYWAIDCKEKRKPFYNVTIANKDH